MLIICEKVSFSFIHSALFLFLFHRIVFGLEKRRRNEAKEKFGNWFSVTYTNNIYNDIGAGVLLICYVFGEKMVQPEGIKSMLIYVFTW